MLLDPSPAGVAARQTMIDAIEFKNTEFNAQGTELNHRYNSNAVLPDPAAAEENFERDRLLYLQATTRPGAKVPHVWLVDETGHKISTLDVTGKGKMSLVTGLSGQAWVAAADKLQLPFLRTVVTGAKGSKDSYGDWSRARQTDEAGAILVRPDGYVAWRHTAAVWDDEEAFHLLQQAIDTALSRR
jgi:2,4-dichlorophenol 6-monooxygenase